MINTYSIMDYCFLVLKTPPHTQKKKKLNEFRIGINRKLGIDIVYRWPVKSSIRWHVHPSPSYFTLQHFPLHHILIWKLMKFYTQIIINMLIHDHNLKWNVNMCWIKSFKLWFLSSRLHQGGLTHPSFMHMVSSFR